MLTGDDEDQVASCGAHRRDDPRSLLTREELAHRRLDVEATGACAVVSLDGSPHDGRGTDDALPDKALSTQLLGPVDESVETRTGCAALARYANALHTRRTEGAE